MDSSGSSRFFGRLFGDSSEMSDLVPADSSLGDPFGNMSLASESLVSSFSVTELVSPVSDLSAASSELSDLSLDSMSGVDTLSSVDLAESSPGVSELSFEGCSLSVTLAVSHLELVFLDVSPDDLLLGSSDLVDSVATSLSFNSDFS